MQLLDFLNRIQPLTKKEQEQATRFFIREEYRKGDFYLSEHQHPNKISFIESGLFRLFYNIDGEEKVMLFFHENQFMTDYFGFLTKTPSIRPIQALENSVVHSIHRDNLDTLFKSSKSWEHIGRILAESAYITSVLRANRLLHDDYDTRLNTFITESPSLMQRIPQYMIASYLNMTPETLSRVKKRIMGNSKLKSTIHKNT